MKCVPWMDILTSANPSAVKASCQCGMTFFFRNFVLQVMRLKERSP